MPTPDYVTYILDSGLAAVGSPHTGDAFEIGPHRQLSIQLIGTGIGGADSLQMEQSNDKVTWENLGAGIAAAGVTEDTCDAKFVRSVMTIDTGTAISIVVCAKP